MPGAGGARRPRPLRPERAAKRPSIDTAVKRHSQSFRGRPPYTGAVDAVSGPRRRRGPLGRPHERGGRGSRAGAPRPASLEDAMSAMLGLGLSVFLTVALLGWLMAQDG